MCRCDDCMNALAISKAHTDIISEVKEEARKASENGYTQHVNYSVQSDYYYVSDWYDCDSTIASYYNGQQISN